MALDFQKEIPQLTNDQLTNADNANYPHNVLQKNLLYLYNSLLSTETRFATTLGHIWVDEINGDDSNSGSEDRPFRTLKRASEEITQNIVDTQIIVHVVGYGDSRPYQIDDSTEVIHLDLPEIISTQENLVGLVFKSEEDEVFVDGGQSVKRFMNIKGGAIFFEGDWTIENFLNNGISIEGGIGIRTGSDVNFENNGDSGLSVSKGTCLIDNASVTGSGNGKKTDINIKNGSFCEIKGKSEVGGITVSSNSTIIYENGTGSIVSEDGKEAAVDITKNSHGKITGKGSSDLLSIDSGNHDNPDIKISHGSSVETGHLSLSASDSGYAINCGKNSSISFSDPISWTRDGNGILVTCSCSWDGEETSSLSAMSVNNGHVVSHSDYTCENATASHTIKSSVEGGNGNINPSGIFDVKEGSDITFDIFPDDGYEIDSFEINETDLTSEIEDSSYTLTDIQEEYDVTTSFNEEDDGPDVPEKTYVPLRHDDWIDVNDGENDLSDVLPEGVSFVKVTVTMQIMGRGDAEINTAMRYYDGEEWVTVGLMETKLGDYYHRRKTQFQIQCELRKDKDRVFEPNKDCSIIGYWI